MNFSQALNQTLGYLNAAYGQPAANPLGDPQYPFPLLNWAYRPFNNVYETAAGADRVVVAAAGPKWQQRAGLLRLPRRRNATPG